MGICSILKILRDGWKGFLNFFVRLRAQQGIIQKVRHALITPLPLPKQNNTLLF